jgi:hypothetical protein
MSALGVGKFCQILEDVIGAGVGGLVPLLVAGVVFMQLQVPDSTVRILVEFGGSVVVVDGVALEPLLEAHGAHDEVIGHGVEGVKGVLNTFLGAEPHLEGGGDTGARVTVVLEDLAVLEAPGLEDVGVGIIRLDQIVLLIFLVEEEDLRRRGVTLLAQRNQSFNCVFSQTASVLKRNSLLYSEKSLPALRKHYPRC